MRDFYIGLSRPKKFKIGAWLISKWMRADYSHAYVRFESDRLGISSVYQAAHGMVHFREINKFHEDNETVKEYRLTVSDAKYRKIMKHCMMMCGDPYSKLELAQIVAYDVLNTLKIKAQFKEIKGYICSELAGKICMMVGIEFSKPKFLLTPKDIDIGLEKVAPLAV